MKYTDRQEKDISLLMDLLAISSVNGRDDEGEMARLLRDYFKAHGIEARVQEIDEHHANVSAFIEGEDKGRTLIWNGHLDTVPYGDLKAWTSDPKVPQIREGRIYGRGASDMKSGLAAMVSALCSLKEQGKRPACSILFLGTCDEEKGGLGAEKALKELEGSCFNPDKEKQDSLQEGKERTFLLVGEPTFLRPGIAQKGCLWLQMKVKGRTSHGAYPAQGINAISCGMRIAGEIADYVLSFAHPLLGSATAQVTRIEGGVANNMTPDECTIVMDIRLVPGVLSDQVIEYGKEVLSKEQLQNPGLDIRFEKLNDRRAIEILEDNVKVRQLQSLINESGYDAAPIGINFFTDASVLDRDDHMDICLFGPGDPALAHQPDEYVEIERYLKAVQILEKFAAYAAQPGAVNE